MGAGAPELAADSPRHLRLDSFSRAGRQLMFVFSVSVGNAVHRFSTSYWYSDVDFDSLETLHGREPVDQLCFHIGAFEINKLASLRPATIDFGPFQNFVSPAFEQLWRTIFVKVWAQWRYQHDDPDYLGPRFEPPAKAPDRSPLLIEVISSRSILALCGGGKDSLVALQTLQQVGADYGSLAYSHSVYGRHEPQHALISRLLDRLQPSSRHRLWVYDDVLDAPLIELGIVPGLRELTAAETPSSIFASLPIALAHGYRYLCLGHEKSADVGNLVWQRTGEEINHQWGKSTEAERLINDYLERHLVVGCRAFSILKPLQDVLIFSLLGRYPSDVPSTHSCNVRKPWCRRCAKCAYVWLGYMAYLDSSLVDRLFDGENLFEEPSNLLFFRQMLGLEEHTPFECIGQIDEARLAFELCRRKGMSGLAMQHYSESGVDFCGGTEITANLDQIVERLGTVDRRYESLPKAFAEKILGHFEGAAADARRSIRHRLTCP